MCLEMQKFLRGCTVAALVVIMVVTSANVAVRAEGSGETVQMRGFSIDNVLNRRTITGEEVIMRGLPGSSYLLNWIERGGIEIEEFFWDMFYVNVGVPIQLGAAIGIYPTGNV
jgi:hypothetical protein